ncbi:MAG: 3-isopropylmalate dehydrogenase [Candidatus Woesebacteria bacterium]|jgi:3-isopropylmalate dehydrogenase
MKKSILVLGGDGIGPDVTKQAVKVLRKVAKKFKHQFEFKKALIGAVAIDKTGNPLPEKTISLAKKSDAILFGAIGSPKYDNNPNAKVRPEQGLLGIRKALGLFANLRPIKLFDELLDTSPLKAEVIKGSDILIFRELIAGIYFGARGRTEDLNEAFDTMIYSKESVRRIGKLAFETARTRKKKVCSVDKANVLASSRLWREAIVELAKEYPDVELSHLFVDNAAMQLIKRPSEFDVIVTGNMFGDILSDEASQIAGSLGMLASASMGEKYGLYEPIHGSAPKYAGKNVANPLATILSAQMMLSLAFKMKKEAKAVEKAIGKVLAAGYRCKDIADAKTERNKIVGTEEMGDLVAAAI